MNAPFRPAAGTATLAAHSRPAPEACLITGARVVLPTEVRHDVALLIEDGRIAALEPMASGHAHEVRLQGQLLLPGLIDLHCDAIEKEVEPRPGVHFPLGFAAAQIDRRNAMAGITTIYHAISFANHELGVRNNRMAAELVRALSAARPQGLVDNRVHARYEVTDETAPELLSQLLAEGHVQLLSLMDHSPGQGQFRDVAAYRQYLSRSYQLDEQALDGVMQRKAEAGKGALHRMQALAGLARDHRVALASHDDDSAEKVDMVKALGTTLSEFPINLEAARAARERGLATLFGAPNILRGGSQAGNMRALDAVLNGVADCLCADYAPATLLPAVLRLPELAGISLAQAVAMVSAAPARAAGLSDRGRIEVGLRADLVGVKEMAGMPQAQQVWSAGRRVVHLDF